MTHSAALGGTHSSSIQSKTIFGSGDARYQTVGHHPASSSARAAVIAVCSSANVRARLRSTKCLWPLCRVLSESRRYGRLALAIDLDLTELRLGFLAALDPSLHHPQREHAVTNLDGLALVALEPAVHVGL